MSFSPYEKYIESGVPWLGRTPADWEVLPTKRFAFRIKDLNLGMKCEERLALTMSGVIPRSLDDLEGLQASEFESYQIFHKDDLAFKLIDLQNIKTSRVGIVPFTGIMSPAYIRLVFDRGLVFPKFAYWFFTDLYNRHIFNQLGGGVRQTLGPEELLLLPFARPTDIRDQIQIARFLDHETACIDALIAEQQRLIELLKEKRQAVISHAVTKGLDPTVPMKDSGVEWLGEVPAHWGLRPLKYQCRFSGGGTPSKENLEYWNGEIPWVSPKDMKKFWISDAEDKITEIAVRESSTNIVPPGALLMVVRSGILQRTLPVAINTAPVALNQDMKALRFEVEGVAEFVAFLIAGFEHSVLLAWRKQGATVESIEHEYLANAIIPIPPLAEVEEILNEIRVSEAKFDALARESASLIGGLQERRSALISAAVTGKIDVRGWQPPASTQAPELAVAEAN